MPIGLLFWPTADQVAIAIVTAVKIVGLPLYWAELAARQRSGSMDLRRARIYAAVALRELFDDDHTPGSPGNVSFSRMVGDCKGGLLTAFDNQVRHQGAYWFDRERVEAIKAAVLKSSAPQSAAPIKRKLVLVKSNEGYTPTASELMGDPPPGRSALDQQRGRGC
jgi:hypothetical protein